MAMSIVVEGLDTDTFLKSNGLEDLIPKFKKAQFTIEDLVICTEDDIRSICDTEFKLKPTQKIRLIKAIKSISNAEINKKVETPKIVFLGDEEKKILEKLYKKNDTIFGNVKQIQLAMDELQKTAVQCTKEVHVKHEEMVSILEKHRKSLLDKITNLKNKRYEELQSYLNQLKSLNEVAVKASSQCQQFASKPNISSSDRLQKMQQVATKFNDDEKQMNINTNDMNTTNFKLCINYNQQSFKSNLQKALDVGFDDEKFEVKEIKHDPWTFPDNHPCLVVSNNGLTVNGLSGKAGTILFGEFLESGFRAVEFKLDRDSNCPALCVIGKQFHRWERSHDWAYVRERGNRIGIYFASKTKFRMAVNDIVSIMIDMNKNEGEFKNKTQQQHIKFNLPKRPCGIAIYCNNCQFTVTKQISSFNSSLTDNL